MLLQHFSCCLFCVLHFPPRTWPLFGETGKRTINARFCVRAAVPCGEQKAPVTRYFLSSVSFSRNKTLVSMFFILFSLNRKVGGGGTGEMSSRVRPGLETWVSCQLWDIGPAPFRCGWGRGNPFISKSRDGPGILNTEQSRVRPGIIPYLHCRRILGCCRVNPATTHHIFCSVNGCRSILLDTRVALLGQPTQVIFFFGHPFTQRPTRVQLGNNLG